MSANRLARPARSVLLTWAFWAPQLVLGLPLIFTGSLGLVACSLSSDPQSQAIDHAIQFAPPEMVSVTRGDTLALIGKRYGVTAADLRAWNGIKGDLIEIGQQLRTWRAPSAPPDITDRLPEHMRPAPAAGSRLAKALSSGAATPRTAPSGTAAAPGRARTAPRPATARSPSPASPTLAAALAPEPHEPVDEALDEEAGEGLALLTGLSQGSGIGGKLSDQVDNLSGRGSTPGRSGLGARTGGLGAGTTAEGSADMDRRPPPTMGPSIPNTPVSPPKLAMPAPKRCLAGPTQGPSSERGMVTNQGLSTTQLKTALSAFTRNTKACIPAGTSGKFTVQLSFHVGCDGRASAVTVYSSSSGVPSAVAECVAETMRHTPFPAHDLPDGAQFQYPLHFAY